MKWLLLLSLLPLSAMAKQEQKYALGDQIQPATEEWHLFGQVRNIINAGTATPSSPSDHPNRPAITFKEWQSYQDKAISFKYPKSPFITVKKINGTELKPKNPRKLPPTMLAHQQYQILLRGEVAMTLDYIKVEGFGTYPHYKGNYNMKHQLLRPVGKALAKYHFWMGGVLSDVQVSNDKELIKCLVTEDPTSAHPLTLATRSKIAASLKLRSSYGKTKQQWLKLVSDRAGWKGLSGFLYKGMPYQDVIDLLGKPSTTEDKNKRIWLKQGDNYPLRLELVFDSNNNLSSLPNFGVETDYTAPIVGKLAWIKNITSRRNYLNRLPLKKVFGAPVTLKSVDGTNSHQSSFAYYTSPEIPLTPENKEKVHQALLKLMNSPLARVRTKATAIASRLISKWQLKPAPFANLIIQHKIESASAAKILRQTDKKMFIEWVVPHLEKLYSKTWTSKFT